jgi:prepilin-type N-terminal cleavage/methylation domain-containing protein
MIQPQPKNSQSAFTLLELSIALVIIGLLVGGVLAGRNLITAAKYNSIASEFQGYQKAISSFYDIYHGLPGDLSTAAQIWGQRPSCSSLYSGDDPGVCNGTGDGKIGEKLNSICTGGGSYRGFEGQQMWTHLSKAGLVSTYYRGDAAYVQPGIIGSVGGHNVPSAQFGSGTIWMLANTYCWPYYWNQDSAPTEHGLFIGAGPSSGQTPDRGASPFSAMDVSLLDRKIDDGKANTGKVRVQLVISSGWNCTTSSSYTPAGAVDYEMDDTIKCNPYFVLENL